MGKIRSFLAACCMAAGAVAAVLPMAAQATSAPFKSAVRYDAMGHVTGTITADPDGNGSLPYLATRTTYDAQGRPIEVEKGTLSSWQDDTVAPSNWASSWASVSTSSLFTVYSAVETTYDVMGRKLTVALLGSDGNVYALTQYSYDSVGRLQCTAVRMNPAVYTSLPASACTLGTQGSNGPDRITENVYDVAGELIQVRKAVGTSIEQAYATYSYTPNGKQDYVIDANGNRAEFTYDGFDRLQRWYFPSSTRPTSYDGSTQATALQTAGSINTADYEEYAYDANGNRTSLRKRDGSVLTYTYDALNRMTEKVVPTRSGLPATDSRSVFYGYDLQGHQLYARFDSATGEGVTQTWDGFGEISSSTLTMDGVTRTLTYQYDADGNRTRMTFPDSNYVTYAYDGLDRPTSILRSGSATIASFTYDNAGRRIAFDSGGSGALATTYGYDTAGRLASLTNTPANTSYGLTINGPCASNSAVCYNPAGQITSMTKDNDLFAWTGAVNVSRSYTTNGLNQYTAAGSASFTYDPNGNLTSDGSNTYNYDIENRMVSVSGGNTASLRYDPLGRLYEVVGSSGTTRFFYDGDALVGEYDASGNLLRRYVHGTNMAADDPLAWYEGSGFAAANERFLRPNWQGSIVLVTDSTGQTIDAVNTYDEYGIPGANNTGRFQYTGQAWIPELGMYYYKARMYSPTLGRFMQTDPVGYKDQIDLYAYVGNDPVDKEDFSGNQMAQAIEWGAKAGCAADAETGCVPGAVVGAIGGAIIGGCIEFCGTIFHNDQGTDGDKGTTPDKGAPEVKPGDLKGKTDGEIRDTAKGKGLVPDSKNPNKFRDPNTGKERIRIDKGHVDPKTGKPYDNPNAAGPHAHGYEPDGKTPVRDPDTGDKHFPIRPDF